MRGTGLLGRRRPAAWVLVGAVATMPVAALGVPAPAPASASAAASATVSATASADVMSVPGTMSTAAENTSSFPVHVPAGVEVRALIGAVTMPEVVEGGTITFRINGAVRKTVPSALYQKVRIPVDGPDVVADGTIGLTMTTEGPAQPGATCLPSGGVASMRNIELDYRGAEVAPTAVSDFFPASSAGITVVIPEDADAQMITAGLTAVGALAHRYADDTPIDLSLSVPPAASATASQRVVALTPGRAGEVTTAVSTTSGIPMLTLTGTGDALVDAARALSTDLLGLSGSDAQDPSQEIKPRSTAKTRTLEDLGIDSLAITGYGSVTEQFELRQDSFGVPVSSIDLHLVGSHTAFSDASGARLDVRANGDLVGSTVLGPEATFALDAHLPSSKLRSVNHLEVTLNAVAPDGSACTTPSIPAAEVDLDTGASEVTVAHGTGATKGFQLFPQIFEGTLPVALRSTGRQASAAINAAALIVELQRSAGSLLEIQLMQPDAFLADDRSGLMVGALSADSDSLDAPLKLSSTRLVDRDDETIDFTSQDPYAVLESIDRNNRLVLMLGSWAPGNRAAPGELARKVVDAVVSSGWDNLDGDLVIADAASPTFVASSRSLAPHQEVKKERSLATLFVVLIGLVLLALLFQLVVAIRRDRRLSRDRDDEFEDDGPAYVEDQDHYELDELGDVDDLEVHDYVAAPGRGHPDRPAYEDDDTGEIEAVAADYDEYADEGDEPDEIELDEADVEPDEIDEDEVDEDEVEAAEVKVAAEVEAEVEDDVEPDEVEAAEVKVAAEVEAEVEDDVEAEVEDDVEPDEAEVGDDVEPDEAEVEDDVEPDDEPVDEAADTADTDADESPQTDAESAIEDESNEPADESEPDPDPQPKPRPKPRTPPAKRPGGQVKRSKRRR